MKICISAFLIISYTSFGLGAGGLIEGGISNAELPGWCTSDQNVIPTALQDIWYKMVGGLTDCTIACRNVAAPGYKFQTICNVDNLTEDAKDAHCKGGIAVMASVSTATRCRSYSCHKNMNGKLVYTLICYDPTNWSFLSK